MAQIINFLVTVFEMVGLRGVSSYSKAGSFSNTLMMAVICFSFFTNIYFLFDYVSVKSDAAKLKMCTAEAETLKDELRAREAAVTALSETLSMFIPNRVDPKTLPGPGPFPSPKKAPLPSPPPSGSRENIKEPKKGSPSYD